MKLFIQEWFPYRAEETYQLVKEALEPKVVDGYYILTDAPGLGIELNDEVMSKYPCIKIN
jgi:L-alanine-DL-glutamate epimerase-like enolase superfamily enzyme